MNAEGEVKIDQEDVQRLKELIASQITGTAAVLCANNQTVELLDACVSQNPEQTFAAITMNTEQAGQIMSAAIYLLYRKGQLPSLKGNVTPWKIGLFAASQLEKNAAVKNWAAGNLSWEAALNIIKKTCTIALTLLVGYVVIHLVMITGFTVSLVVNLLVVGVAVTAAVAYVGYRFGSKVVDALRPTFNWIKSVGGEKLEAGLNLVRDGYQKLAEWVNETAILQLRSVFNDCVDFLMEKIVLPAERLLNRVVEVAYPREKDLTA